MFAIEIQSAFSAAHALRLPGGAVEPLHGHDFQVSIRITAPTLDALETVVDFHIVQEYLEAIVKPWRNANLNEISPFDRSVNPSAERIAEGIGYAMGAKLAEFAATPGGRKLRLAEVRITEAANCLAIWFPD